METLKRALRGLEGGAIITMGFFIRDLHRAIRELHQKQLGSYHGKSFIVYRGQGLLKSDFANLRKAKHGLMSFNNFLSTSHDRAVSLSFVKSAMGNTGNVGILFRITIDPSISSTPFASVQEVSFFQAEEELLFSMHSVFRVEDIHKVDSDTSVYEVDLRLTSDDDPGLRILTDRIREEVVGKNGWSRLGMLLLKLRQNDKAEELYNVLLERTSIPAEKVPYYNHLGYA